MTHNIFHSLFSYRPREDRSSKENFLTEAFAHTLRANPDVCRAWLHNLTGEPLEALCGPLDVETQATFRAPDGKAWSIVDMAIRCGLTDGSEVLVLSEHKWESGPDCEQLKRYCSITSARAKTKVVFIAPTEMQIAEVRELMDDVRALLWQDIHNLLQKSGSDGVQEFVAFLALQGLGPTEPLSWPKLAAYVTSRSVERDCLRIADQLRSRDWTFLPKRFQTSFAPKKLRWGRIGIELNTDWNPGLFLGFLLDGEDHQLTLLSPRTSIDLMLAFDADPKLTLNAEVLGPLAERLRAPGVEILQSPQLKSKWRKLVVREPLSETIRGKTTDMEQIEIIYGRLKQWCTALFEDGQLEKAFEKM